MGNVIYVATDGNDSSATGSQNNPYATVNAAINAANNGDAIYINPGQYDVTNAGSSHGIDSGLNNFGKNVDFIGVSGQTILNIDGRNTDRDVHFYSGKGFSKIYNMVFIRNSNNRGTNYNNSFFGYGFVQGGNL